MSQPRSIPLANAPAGPTGAASPLSGSAHAGEGLAQPHPPVRALYIHVPFCFHKCHYCDFYSFVDQHDQQEAFVVRLINELQSLAPHAGALTTVFVGGGTPSLLRVPLWERLLAALHDTFDTRALQSAGEFTVECNPETVNPELARVLADGGVNRISVGAQSFVDRHLKTLERWHDPANVEKALDTVRKAGIAKVSLDLIYAIPGQTLAEWRADLARALSMGTTHLSCYNLTYEPNTAMSVRLGRGEFVPAEEELETEMFEVTQAMAAQHGLARYEVSNYARPGDECRHNLAYWHQDDWLAAGPSASGHVQGARWKNIPRLPDYLASAGFAPVVDVEPVDAGRAVRERLMTGVRLACGVPASIAERAESASPGAASRLRAKAAEFMGDGLLENDPLHWRVTPGGWLLADFLARKLMACV